MRDRCIGPCRMPRSGQRMQEQHQPPGPYTTSLFSFHVKPAFNEQSARQANPRFTFRHRQVHVSRETAKAIKRQAKFGEASMCVGCPHVASHHRGDPYVNRRRRFRLRL